MQTGQDIDEDAVPQGPFVLAGPVERADPRTTPLRGDIAHIALAGRYFVPNYVVPIERMVGDMGANLRTEPSDASEIVHDLSPGQRFDLLDATGDWGWGCCSLNGPVGYVKLAELLDPYS